MGQEGLVFGSQFWVVCQYLISLDNLILRWENREQTEFSPKVRGYKIKQIVTAGEQKTKRPHQAQDFIAERVCTY